ncbi:MAG: Fic family protein, partial [Flavobacteriales bacterium]|nr:Fic family protein [Flavobacteriales bacterium]
ADFLLGKLAREGSKIPNPHLLIRPFMTREAVLSSQIEGTQATLGEVLAHDAGALGAKNSDDIQEVQNYIAALDYGLQRMQDFPLSLRLIREIHERLMDGVRGQHATPGEFRHSQNWIGTPGCTLNTAKFVPPPPDQLLQCLGDLETFLHDRQLPPLIHIALCHYQFETIHPFLDGNGRIGRLLITLLLIEREILPAPILYLSAFFEASRDEYYKQLFQLSRDGQWNEWFVYFLNGVAAQSQDALSRTEKINDLLMKWKLEVKGTALSLKLIDKLAVNPFITAKKIMSEYDVAHSTAQRAIQALLKHGVISQKGDNQRDKVFCAQELLDILEAPPSLRSYEGV